MLSILDEMIDNDDARGLREDSRLYAGVERGSRLRPCLAGVRDGVRFVRCLGKG